MLPTITQAFQELKIAGIQNPGPWTKHSENTGLAAHNIAQKLPGMDAKKAHILGLLHDIGRRVGVVNTPKHVYEGYRYCMEHGWEEAAKISMTHSWKRNSISNRKVWRSAKLKLLSKIANAMTTTA